MKNYTRIPQEHNVILYEPAKLPNYIQNSLDALNKALAKMSYQDKKKLAQKVGIRIRPQIKTTGDLLLHIMNKTW